VHAALSCGAITEIPLRISHRACRGVDRSTPSVLKDLPLEPPRFNLASMTVALATAYFALLAAMLHFVSHKLKKIAERKSFHVKDAT
jgi:hypothetical protein